MSWKLQLIFCPNVVMLISYRWHYSNWLWHWALFGRRSLAWWIFVILNAEDCEIILTGINFLLNQGSLAFIAYFASFANSLPAVLLLGTLGGSTFWEGAVYPLHAHSVRCFACLQKLYSILWGLARSWFQVCWNGVLLNCNIRKFKEELHSISCTGC